MIVGAMLYMQMRLCHSVFGDVMLLLKYKVRSQAITQGIARSYFKYDMWRIFES
jgi:hypothetical protein